MNTAQTPDCGGLSPRVRGKLNPRYGVAKAGGSIPACAGEAGRGCYRTM